MAPLSLPSSGVTEQTECTQGRHSHREPLRFHGTPFPRDVWGEITKTLGILPEVLGRYATDSRLFGELYLRSFDTFSEGTD